MKKKTSPIIGMQRDKLIIALQMYDLVGALNLAMRVRRMVFTLDYTTGYNPRMLMSMPGIDPEQVMLLDPRKHVCYITPPRNKDLFFGFVDITERLDKIGGRLSLTGDKPKEGPRRCVLQVYVDGVTKTALTLMDVKKGKRKHDTSFELPDGTTP